MKKIMSFVLTFVMLITPFSLPIDAYAASKPKKITVSSVETASTSITANFKELVKGPIYIQIQASTSKDFKKNKKTATKYLKKKNATYSSSVKELKSGKKYYVRVRLYKQSGKKKIYGSWSNVKKITTNPKPKIPNITEISNLTDKIGFKICWNKVSGAEGYQIQYSDNKSFSSSLGKVYVSNVKNSSVTKKTIINCDDDKTYYVRIRTLKKGVYSSWSKCFEVSVVGLATKCASDAIILLDKAYAEMNITSDMSDLQKIAQIQKWIDANWHYTCIGDTHNGTCYCELEDYNSNTYVGGRAHLIAIEGHGGCQNFAYAFRYLANKAGVPCEVLNGDANYENTRHYWNYIKVNECWYEYDCEGTYADGRRPDYRFVSRVGSSYTLSDSSLKVYNSNQPCASSYEARQLSKTFITLMNY